MARTMSPATSQTLTDARDVLEHLRQALALAKRAGSPKTAERIRAAIKSADGAIRHASRRVAVSPCEVCNHKAPRHTDYCPRHPEPTRY